MAEFIFSYELVVEADSLEEATQEAESLVGTRFIELVNVERIQDE